MKLKAFIITIHKDLLRTFAKFPKMLKALSVTLIETSNDLRLIQYERLLGNKTHQVNFDEVHAADGVPITWCSNLREVCTDKPVLFIGQEILDTFPISQV